MLDKSILKDLDKKNLKGITKNDFKSFYAFLSFVSNFKSIFNDSTMDKMKDFKEKMVKKDNNKDETYSISSLDDLIYERKNIIYNNDERFDLSTGQKSILYLQSFLKTTSNKQCVFIDEPEANLSPFYIHDGIIPLLKDLSDQNKYIFIITHNANITILTNPVKYIYKEYIIEGDKKYKTFYGDTNTKLLINISDKNETRSVDEILPKYLEGGIIAFKERGNKYGLKVTEEECY